MIKYGIKIHKKFLKNFKLNKEFISIIPVRDGSKGLPKKNIKKINGIPLYRIAIDQALRVTKRCILSTDIKEIIDQPQSESCIVHKRKKDLCTDNSQMKDVILNIIEEYKLEKYFIVLLQATSPLRLDSDIDKCIKLFLSNPDCMVVSAAKENPEILKSGFIDKDGFFKGLRDTADCFKNRQNLPPVYKPNGSIYIFSAKHFLNSNSFPTKLIKIFEMPKDRSLEIDSQEDYDKVVKYLNI